MKSAKPWQRRAILAAVSLAAFIAVTWTIPHRWCARNASQWFDGDHATRNALARQVEDRVRTDLRGQFATGSEKFDGEWVFGTYQMAGLGLAQCAHEQPADRDRLMPVIEKCIEQLVSPHAQAFDTQTWNENALDTLENGDGHAAYLGYLNLLLSYARLLDAENNGSSVGLDPQYVELNDRITTALAKRIDASPTLLIETYPGESYPVDNAAVIGSIALYDRATGRDHSGLVHRWIERCRRDYIDSQTGLLIQAVRSSDGGVVDGPRGSGTCLGSYFLSFVDDPIAGDLYAATKQELAGYPLGFGMVREYPRGVFGLGDIDSGPVIFGYSFSATGFALGGARTHGDRPFFSRLYATAHLFGAPRRDGDRLEFIAGGPLGEAIMLAMLTARPQHVSHTGGIRR